MAHGYTKEVSESDIVVYVKRHDNGEETEVQLEKAGTQATGTSWLVNVTDPNGSQRVGRFPTKRAARQRATKWMSNHPKGVQGSGGAMGAVNAMEEATNSIFTGGGRF